MAAVCRHRHGYRKRYQVLTETQTNVFRKLRSISDIIGWRIGCGIAAKHCLLAARWEWHVHIIALSMSHHSRFVLPHWYVVFTTPTLILIVECFFFPKPLLDFKSFLSSVLHVFISGAGNPTACHYWLKSQAHHQSATVPHTGEQTNICN